MKNKPDNNSSTDEASNQIEKENFAKLVKQSMEEGQPLYLLLGLKKEDIEAIYEYGRQLYNDEDYAKSFRQFSEIVYLDKYHKNAWMGAANSLKALKEYNMAIMAYKSALLMDGEDPIPYFNIYECLIELGTISTAAKALEIAIKLSQGKKKFAELTQEATRLKRTIEEELA